MSQPPAYFRARGRGRGRLPGHSVDAAPPGHNNGIAQAAASAKSAGRGRGTWHRGDGGQTAEDTDTARGLTAEMRFAHAHNKLQDSVQRHLQKTAGDFEDSDDDEDEADYHPTKIFENLLDSFSLASGTKDSLLLGNSHDYLSNYFQSGSNVCLICFETMKKTEAVWSCQCCYCIFHLPCIQKWVRDGVYQHSYQLSADNFPNRDFPWYCPKCRYEYSQSECPTRYTCFCGKVTDPVFDPWLAHHSCSDICERALKPECGHKCLLPCHPGPCPPCPQTVNVSCHCGKRPPEPRRCGSRQWSCGNACGRQLQCGLHTCDNACHTGECKPCPRSGGQSCVCGKDEMVRPCASPIWHCEKPCNRPLLCGHHRCEKVCHNDVCGMCPRSLVRFCPCGKAEHHSLTCTEDVPTCGDTCGKTLDCGLHPCTQRCHYGPCGTCREMTEKRCRCESRVKSVQCYKDYQCETRCNRMRKCGKHPCKRKCCDGKCPECEQVCNKSLQCKTHKCTSLCHTGACYPCPLTAVVGCYCGQTKVRVPCGREKLTKKPRCRLDCRIPPDCHHPSRVRHLCHYGPCPVCSQVCGRSYNNCQHTCPHTCHTAVRKLVKEKVKRAGPWEAVPEVREEVVCMPCPPCQVPIEVECLGKHEISSVWCSKVSPYSCMRECGRLLKCGNHMCALLCHDVVGATNKELAGSSCVVCEEMCSRPRPDGCPHPCPLPCHHGDCPPCKQMIRMRCHCQISVRHVECHRWNGAPDNCAPGTAGVDRRSLNACGDKCPKKLSCGHSCLLSCHPPPCTAPDQCKESVTLRCACKRRRQVAPCADVQRAAGAIKLECDQVCQQLIDEKNKVAEEQMEQERRAEQLKQQKDLEDFERKTKGRSRQRKRRPLAEDERSFQQKYGRALLLSVIVLLTAVFITHLCRQ